MIGIIDYKAGNAPSVLNALQTLGIPSILITKPGDMQACEGIILPGVGSAKATMDSLDELHFIKPLKQAVMVEHKPFLGICIGLQVLFDHSEEGNIDTLGFLKGQVRRFNDKQVRVPQIGWNEVAFIKDSPLLKGMEKQGHFYFVNSYYACPEDEGIVLGRAEYGTPFTAMVCDKNIFASQCHLEKSGVLGLILLKNFAHLAKGGSLC